jgi:lipopolysaccharide transport system permease protein
METGGVVDIDSEIRSDPRSGDGTERARRAVRRIQPSNGWVPISLSELWEYRELFLFIVWRDFKVRYKQTVLGALWAVIQPVTTMVVFSIFLGKLANVPSDGVPYPIFSFSGILPWNLFATGMHVSSMCLVLSAHLIPKVYFPRIVLPTAGVLTGLVDFCIAFVVLLGMMVWFGIAPTVNVIWLPCFLLLAMVSALGIGLWLAAINVHYRDVMYILPFFMQIWMFATPVVYPSSLLGEPWHTIYALNPMVGVVEGFRWALLGTATAPSGLILVSSAVAILILISGAFVFRRMEKSFADMI